MSTQTRDCLLSSAKAFETVLVVLVISLIIVSEALALEPTSLRRAILIVMLALTVVICTLLDVYKSPTNWKDRLDLLSPDNRSRWRRWWKVVIFLHLVTLSGFLATLYLHLELNIFMLFIPFMLALFIVESYGRTLGVLFVDLDIKWPQFGKGRPHAS